MLDDVQDQIRTWLDCEPTLSALAVLTRLKLACPDRFIDQHLRTVQHAVKVWRREQARRIVMQSAISLSVGALDAAQIERVCTQSRNLEPRVAPGAHRRLPHAAAPDSCGRSAARGSLLWTPGTTRSCGRRSRAR